MMAHGKQRLGSWSVLSKNKWGRTGKVELTGANGDPMKVEVSVDQLNNKIEELLAKE
jgi:hypothetical protein